MRHCLAIRHSLSAPHCLHSSPSRPRERERLTRGFAGELNHVLDLHVVVEADAARVALRVQRGRPLALLPREQLVGRPVVRVAVGKVLPPLPLPRALCFGGGVGVGVVGVVGGGGGGRGGRR